MFVSAIPDLSWVVHNSANACTELTLSVMMLEYPCCRAPRIPTNSARYGVSYQICLLVGNLLVGISWTCQKYLGLGAGLGCNMFISSLANWLCIPLHVVVQEEGVTFQSPVDGSRMLLTPEQSMAIQNDLGADIMMQLDDVVPATNTDPERFREATFRTTRWLDRCIKAHRRPNEQNLFPIVQGGFDVELREISMQQLVERNAPGYAIGGLAGGETKDMFWRVVAQCAAGLPPGKPRYVMGIGYPLDILVCSALGADMYDSVYPTRTARFGVALLDSGVMKLRNASFVKDFRPIDPDCDCMTCQRYSRSYLHNVVTRGVPSASILVSYHNVAYTQRLTRRIRAAIKAGHLPEFVRSYLSVMFPKRDVPQWVVDALDVAGISLEEVALLKPAHDWINGQPPELAAAAAGGAVAAPVNDGQ